MPLNPADASFAESLSRMLPQGTVATADPRYLEEPRGRWQGTQGFVARPRSTDEVARIVTACAEARVGLVPYGGGTGLVGGQIFPEGSGPAPLILSLERMSAIRAVHADEFVLIAEAGAILASVQEAARAHDRLFPLSLASEGSARIGGLLSTNAGGVNVLRYGNARDLCLGVEAVLPGGTVFHGLKRLRKDNTGYDLRNLLVGAEGTLGVITAAVLKLSPLPAAEGTALFRVPSPEAALALLSLARNMVGDGVSAFELIDGQGLEFLSEKLPDLRQPFPDIPKWSVLIELGLARGLDPAEILAALFEEALAADLVTDGLVAQSEAQREAFWAVRERIPEANRMVGAVSSHDISVPLGNLAGFIREATARIAELGAFRINCFGHVGDGNLHFNVFPPAGQSRDALEHMSGQVQHMVHEVVRSFDGSISAEHGIGRLKVSDLQDHADPAKLAAMRAIKSALDPLGIMNPGAVLA